MAVDVLIEDTRWESAALDTLANTAVAATLSHLMMDPDDWEVSLLGCDDARIAVLNEQFRGKPLPTNVLSWPSEDLAATEEGRSPNPPSDPELGDIALAFETCQREAAEQNKLFEQHIVHLIVHGLLHLLGYDHVRNGDGDLMEATETAILQTLGVPDPY